MAAQQVQGANVGRISDQELIARWETVGRNSDPHRLDEIAKFIVEPKGPIEDAYLETRREMVKRGLSLGEYQARANLPKYLMDVS